jgi:hypothetical protein
VIVIPPPASILFTVGFAIGRYPADIVAAFLKYRVLLSNSLNVIGEFFGEGPYCLVVIVVGDAAIKSYCYII